MKSSADPQHPLRSVRRLVLEGFMGSGKTTVGRLLAAQLGWHFADLDDAVCAETGCSIAALLHDRGEAVFRVAEVQVLRGLLQQTHLVIALGGGAPETPEIQELLRGDAATAVVYLHAPLDVLYARCMQQAGDSQAAARPLLGTPEAAQGRYGRRLAVYRSLAHATIDVSQAAPQGVSARVLAWMDDFRDRA